MCVCRGGGRGTGVRCRRFINILLHNTPLFTHEITTSKRTKISSLDFNHLSLAKDTSSRDPQNEHNRNTSVTVIRRNTACIPRRNNADRNNGNVIDKAIWCPTKTLAPGSHSLQTPSESGPQRRHRNDGRT